MNKRNSTNKDKSPQQQQRNTVVSTHQTQVHTGPLPVPTVMGEYNKIIPGAAERILRMAEKDQDHFIEINKLAITLKSKDSARGQWFGLISTVLAFYVVGYMSYLGHAVEAASFGGTVIVGLAIAFISGRKDK